MSCWNCVITHYNNQTLEVVDSEIGLLKHNIDRIVREVETYARYADELTIRLNDDIIVIEYNDNVYISDWKLTTLTVNGTTTHSESMSDDMLKALYPCPTLVRYIIYAFCGMF